MHGNVNVFSIFVTIDGEWKLGGVEYVHPVANDPVAKISALTRYDPPEGIASKKQEPWYVGISISTLVTIEQKLES